MENQSTIKHVTKQGKVVSTKMAKTIVVEVERKYRHPIYRKTVRSRKNYKAHDEYGKAKMGDLVEIEEHRPISKTKRWKLSRIIRSNS